MSEQTEFKVGDTVRSFVKATTPFEWNDNPWNDNSKIEYKLKGMTVTGFVTQCGHFEEWQKPTKTLSPLYLLSSTANFPFDGSDFATTRLVLTEKFVKHKLYWLL